MNAVHLENVCRRCRKLASFPSLKSDMCGNLLIAKFFDNVGKTVVLGVDVRVVDLVRIASEYDLRSLSCAG